MATKTWTGAGANELWNTAANWSGGTIPVAGDDIVFDGVAANGKKNCTLNVSFSALSVTFTAGYSNTGVSPFNGTFTFGASLTIGAGGLTLGANTTYNTSGTVTTYTVSLNATSTLTSNGKKLPTNLIMGGAGTTLTLSGNADFEGNLTGSTNAFNLKAATLTTVDLRIGGNISPGNVTVNTADFVTIKGYGISKTYGSNAAATNLRCNFVSGSVYTSLGSSALSGTSFLTVEAGGQFNAVSTHNFSNNGTTTISGFNASNNSDFFAYTNGNLVLSTDIVIKSFIQITTVAMTITSSGASKLLLEGNFTATGGAPTTIQRLEFSGASTSNVTATTNPTNLQIQELIINKTGAGSVVFNPISANPFRLYIPTGATYSWTHISGTVTQSNTSVIVISAQSATSQFNYSTAVPTFKFSYLEISAGIINLSSTLNCTLLKLSLAFNTTFTSPTTFGFTVDKLQVINTVNGLRAIVLKSAVTYSILYDLSMLGALGGTSGSITLSSSTALTKAIFNLETVAQQQVEVVSPTDIDSSGNNGVGSPIKQTIYSLNGTLTRTFNWGTGVQPPPVGAKITVGYTFVN